MGIVESARKADEISNSGGRSISSNTHGYTRVRESTVSSRIDLHVVIRAASNLSGFDSVEHTGLDGTEYGGRRKHGADGILDGLRGLHVVEVDWLYWFIGLYLEFA